ncbi:DNA-3-methyladenine glycosylase III (plasmid) [Gemmatirosa kalamazoonensis]|uniref:DNA-3-methyladenine glycosylase III n=1 Tax=Gemmatirosa kalamazoonensis TaxID=861299 RepID=W0RTH3_9BACT|nr:hypothetical protein [Gemmatirosa kalamazoonensis]AHG93742.1 DNA-3-methyladenine glycosylase III [Gemmatirosa kalamazoonensis]
MGARIDLPPLAATLRAMYGRPTAPAPRSAFEWVLWENVAYLADEETRAIAFGELRDRVGLTPEAIVATPLEALHAITARGILAARFAGKLHLAAQRAVVEHAGDLDTAVRTAFARSPSAALAVLTGFPSIGQPGAERILLFMGLLPVLALDSAGLRVLQRLGAAREQRSYDATYRAVRAAVDASGPHPMPLLRELSLLLGTHGRRTCRRSAPRCDACPLRTSCDHAATMPLLPNGSLAPDVVPLPPS